MNNFSVLVNFKEPQKNGLNVKRFDNVASFILLADYLSLYSKYPDDWEFSLDMAEVAHIQIVPAPSDIAVKPEVITRLLV